MNILVTDGENRASLAVLRSLGKRGNRVLVTGIDRNNISASSKYCAKAFVVADPFQESTNYAQQILGIVKKEEIDVVFPMTEQSIYSLNKIRDGFKMNPVLACAPSDMMEAVSDKNKLFQMAERLGVAIPSTTYVPDAADFLNGKVQVTRFPVVVKPALSKIQDGERIISTGVMYAADGEELNRLYATKPALRHPSMIQEMIVGEGTGLFTLFDGDRHLALFSHRRLLEKPPSGGVSVLSESIPLDEEMVGAATRLLSAVGWRGVAMVEFKRDVRDGRAKLMEINGRFWGSLQLAVSSGVDFPVLCLDYCLGKKPSSLISDFSIGHRLKWPLGILDHMLILMKKGDLTQKPTTGHPSLLKVATELLSFGDGKTSFDVYNSDDRKPFFTELVKYIENMLWLRK